MLPILYKANETNFTHNGIGLLRDTITAVATEELNGMFELQMEYDSKGEFAHVINEEMIIKAKANDKQDPQLFRIYSIEKHHDTDNLIIDAQHVTYDFANNFVEKLEARNITKKQVMELIGASTVYPHPFNVTSSNNTTRSTTNLYRTNPLQMIGGMDGSVLQIWGGQLERDNYHLIMHDRRGKDDGVKIQYAKNLTGLTAKVDISNVVTRIYPFAYNDEDDRLITITGKYVDSDHINDYDIIRVMPVDYSQDEEIDWEQTDAQIRSKLTQLASRYFIETGNDKPKTEIDVEFEHLWETKEYKDLDVLELVGMGDTVHIHHSELNVTATAIVNRIEYDVLADVNIRVGIGNVKSRLSDSMNRIDRVEEKVDQAESNANQAIISANGKNKNYYGPDMPTNNLNEGDTWFQLIDGQYTRTWRYDGIQWQLIIDMDVNDAYEQSQEAKADAQQAVDRANQATEDANQAISNAQSAFDQAQSAINQSTSAFNLASQAFEDVAALSTMVDTNTGEISTIKQSVQGLQVSVSDAAGNASNALQIAAGLQTTVSNVEGQVSTLEQTASNISSRIDNLQIGGTNLVLNSDVPRSSTSYYIGTYTMSEDWELNTEYTAVIKGSLNDNNQRFGIWANGTQTRVSILNYDSLKGVYFAVFKTPASIDATITKRAYIYNYPSNGAVSASIDWIKIAKGNIKIIDWSPAPEDTDQKFSAINQTIDNIATRVQTSENNYSSLSQTVSGFQTTVSNMEGDLSTVTQLANTLQSDLRDAEGNINTLTQTATSLKSTISNMQIGGTNLNRDSNNFSRNVLIPYDASIVVVTENVSVEEWGATDATQIRASEGDSTSLLKVFKNINNTTRTVLGETYTISFYVKNLRDIPMSINVNGLLPRPTVIIDANVSKRIVVTGERGSNLLQLQFRSNDYNRYTQFIVWRAQVEEGNMVTPWSPAPEDMATQSQITQLSDNINLRVERNDIINQINISTEAILIQGRRIHITGQTTIDNASIDGAKIKNASIGTAQIGEIDAAKINSGELNTNLITIFGGNALDYTTIQGSYLESRGRFNRAWHGVTTTHDVSIRHQNGYIRLRNNSRDHSIYLSDFGLASNPNGISSSGSLLWWEREYSNSDGVTLESAGGVSALRSVASHTVLDSYASAQIISRNAPVFIRPNENRRNYDQSFIFTTASTDGHGYLMYGNEDLGRRNSGLRFTHSGTTRLEVVDENYATGGDTYIEAGYGEFNTIKRRVGNNYIAIQHANVMIVGSDERDRVASNAIYNRTYSGAANVHITGEGTLGRSTSASKYKLNIEKQFDDKNEQLNHSLKILDLNISTWFDKSESEILAKECETGKCMSDDDFTLKRHVGLIAEDVEQAGLVEFVMYDKGIIESIAYDRLWVHLIPITSNHEYRINWLEIENQYLKQKIKLLEDKVA